MSLDPEKARDLVVDEESFVRFLQALQADWERNRSVIGKDLEAGDWENITIGAFLEAAVAWSEGDAPFAPKATNPWQRCADILLGGKYYE